MPDCKFCGVETFNAKHELCREHYYDFQDHLIDKCKCGRYKDVEYEVCIGCYKSKGTTDGRKKQAISDSNIKGRLAEAIIEEMFIAMGYEVFRFGMENTVPGFGDRYLPRTGPVADIVRKMPDFIVVKDALTAFVEVKYRSDGEFDLNEYYRSRGKYPFPNAYFVLVTPKHIKTQRADRLEKGEDFVYLGSHPDFHSDRDVILRHIDFCKKFFANC